MANNIQTDGGMFDIIFGAKNIVICFLLTIVVLFVASWISVMVNLPEAAVALVVSIITYLCVGICGFRSARHSGSNGLLAGALAGLVYVIILYIIGCIAFAEISFSMSAVLTAVICIVCGAIGGIVGVNTKSKKRR